MQLELLQNVLVVWTIIDLIRGNGVSCAESPSCPVDGFITCPSNGMCVYKSVKCDGVNDCADGTDEAGCPPPVNGCPAGQFPCADGSRCLDGEEVCNGYDDCDDNSDELNCHAKTCPSTGGPWFRCSNTNNRCVGVGSVCDGSGDCTDDQDETGCQVNVQGCTRNKFTCVADNTCLSLSSKVCDGVNDCTDGADEVNCFACAGHPCKNGATCYNQRASGFYCACAPGYKGEHCTCTAPLDCHACHNPCKNGGTCRGNNCICKLWNRGNFCEGTYRRRCGYYWSRDLPCFKPRMAWRIWKRRH